MAKRPIETVDLTGDDDDDEKAMAPNASDAKKIKPASSPAVPTTATVAAAAETAQAVAHPDYLLARPYHAKVVPVLVEMPDGTFLEFQRTMHLASTANIKVAIQQRTGIHPSCQILYQSGQQLANVVPGGDDPWSRGGADTEPLTLVVVTSKFLSVWSPHFSRSICHPHAQLM
jgi:hypothetical protein